MTATDVFDDLAHEGAEVDRLVAGLDDAGWHTPTPAPGWTVHHQIAHLTAVFTMAGMAAAEPDRFRALVSRLTGEFAADVAAAMAPLLELSPAAALDRWRTERAAAGKALAAAAPGQLLPWLVRPIPPAVLAGAGLMELFGHGQDIADALGVEPVRTDRMRHLVEFGVRTWDFGYQARGLPTPDTEFRFEITAPSGTQVWTFGPDDAGQRVSGPAVDFCLLVTRRRHRADLAVTAEGAEAEHWLDLAQAYRGPAGEGRQPGQFA
ncbi:TIGR03084 family metal-binding protein [Actinoplanes sp. N902-109]|uniref:TIGR03084 family metal-binding protein n=1 Tax=Actinoplanes sp. (strain N902-109) TaxID=649831 RepID=UPI0003294D53|nr:TIGR03084 family metal-binding protein [Actinoplanes sp. N902-109]AGL16718.1 wyosine base formation [Actinoplanes sp. N902-109]